MSEPNFWVLPLPEIKISSIFVGFHSFSSKVLNILAFSILKN